MTGASRGIGLAIAEALEREGAHVVRVARSLTPAHADTRTDIPADVTKAPDVERLAATLAADHQVPDILVNNAGSFLLKPLTETTPEEFRGQLESNLVGAFLVLRAFVPMMRERNRGHIVTIGSMADRQVFPGNAAYASAKYGMRALHEALRLETRGTGVRATLVSPAQVDTPLWDAIDPDNREGFTPRSQMLDADAVAAAVVYAVTQPPSVNVDELRLSRS